MAQKVDILLIEDDEVDREAVQRLLSEDYHLRTAATGQEGLALMEANRPDAVLLDYRLPDTNGLELLPTFVERKIPVVVLTVEDTPQTVVEAMKLGAKDYIVKKQLSDAALNLAISNAIEKVNMAIQLEEKQRTLAEQAAVLQQQNEKIRTLASELTLAEQRERKRIAQVLHDNVQQMLHALQVKMLIFDADLSSSPRQDVQVHLREIEALIEQIIRTAKTLAAELSPPFLKGEGLDVAFEWLANQMKDLYGLHIDLEVHEQSYLVGEDVHVLIFQLVRELLFNVVKHAKVDHAKLEMFSRDGYLTVWVIDEGVGFEVKRVTNRTTERGFGLYSVKERLDLFGGQLELESNPGRGTRVAIVLPENQIFDC